MSEENKYRNNHSPDFDRYHGNKMTGKERNDFERGLQKDPFADEASEGFETVDPSIIKSDLRSLENRIRRRVTGRRIIVWYRIAASVAVLMILSSIFIYIERNHGKQQVAYQSPSSVPIEKPSSDEQKEPTAQSEKSEQFEAISRIEPDKNKAEKGSKTRSVQQPENKKDEIVVPTGEALMAGEAAKVAGTEISVKPQLPETAVSGKNLSMSTQIKGRVISSEDNRPIPGANIRIKGTNTGTVTDTGGNFTISVNNARDKMLVADYIGMTTREFMAGKDTNIEIRLDPSPATLSETVVVGYGINKAENPETEDETTYTPPVPEIGKAGFDKYIKDNIRRPDSSSVGQRVVVVLNFIVSESGNIDSLKIVKSPGKEFSVEALRLIKDGPLWKPAMKNGKSVRDEVRIRIVFR